MESIPAGKSDANQRQTSLIVVTLTAHAEELI